MCFTAIFYSAVQFWKLTWESNSFLTQKSPPGAKQPRQSSPIPLIKICQNVRRNTSFRIWDVHVSETEKYIFPNHKSLHPTQSTIAKVVQSPFIKMCQNFHLKEKYTFSVNSCFISHITPRKICNFTSPPLDQIARDITNSMCELHLTGYNGDPTIRIRLKNSDFSVKRGNAADVVVGVHSEHSAWSCIELEG